MSDSSSIFFPEGPVLVISADTPSPFDVSSNRAFAFIHIKQSVLVDLVFYTARVAFVQARQSIYNIVFSNRAR